MTKLSVVMISKNQEWNIARLIESVLRETAFLPEKEIVLVDSASTDQTTEVAARYPITVLKLCPEQRLTAAAGRYVGYKHATGDLVLFLDGDMELCQGWLGLALNVMHTTLDAAVITGRVIDQPKLAQTPSGELLQLSPTDVATVTVRQGGGAAMYRRSVLEQVGTFNPYLYADEEPELCLRIRHAGHRILQLSHPIAFHYSAPLKNFSTFLNKRRDHYFLGFGQNIRYFFGKPFLWRYLIERGWGLLPAFAIGFGIAAAVASGLTDQWEWLALWCAVMLLLIAAIAIQKRSLSRAILILIGKLFILEGTIRGVLLKPYDPASYPGRYQLIR